MPNNLTVPAGGAAGTGIDLAGGAENRYINAMSKVVRKTTKSAGLRKVSKPSVRKVLFKAGAAVKKVTKPRKSAKATAAKKAAAYILSAPAGHRTLSHREIKKAVEKVFEERYGTNA